MKILVCGGRKFFNWEEVRAALDDFHFVGGPISCLVQGGAAGADRLAKHWASLRGIQCLEYPANWKEYGREAGMRRNRQMLDENPDIHVVLAFPGGPGTFGMCQEARRRGLKVIELCEPEPPF